MFCTPQTFVWSLVAGIEEIDSVIAPPGRRRSIGSKSQSAGDFDSLRVHPAILVGEKSGDH